MQPQPLNHNWRFHINDISDSRWNNPDDSKWRLLDLPHEWSIELPRSAENTSGNSGGYFSMGSGWYHQTFIPQDDWRDKKIFIEFEGVYMNSVVWLNHHCLGRHPYVYTGLHFDLTPYIDWNSPNKLKVFVDNTHQPNSRLYSGSGICRPVWLIIADPIHVAHCGVYITAPEISEDYALLNIRTKIENESTDESFVTLRTLIRASDGAQVGVHMVDGSIGSGGSYEFESVISIANPELWSLDSLFLYQAKTEVIVNGVVADTGTTVFGIRSIDLNAKDGFLLNGEPVLLKGGCVHHDNGILGAASYPRSEERKIEILKNNGYNAIRCAHNPPSPSFLDACERLGMLVIDESFDCWRDGKNNDGLDGAEINN